MLYICTSLFSFSDVEKIYCNLRKLQTLSARCVWRYIIWTCETICSVKAFFLRLKEVWLPRHSEFLFVSIWKFKVTSHVWARVWRREPRSLCGLYWLTLLFNVRTADSLRPWARSECKRIPRRWTLSGLQSHILVQFMPPWTADWHAILLHWRCSETLKYDTWNEKQRRLGLDGGWQRS